MIACINMVLKKLICKRIYGVRKSVDERHWLPGEGKINWKNVIHSLGKINYSGAFMHEVDYERPSKSRDLTAADFYVNAEEIFVGKELTIIP